MKAVLYFKPDSGNRKWKEKSVVYKVEENMRALDFMNPQNKFLNLIINNAKRFAVEPHALFLFYKPLDEMTVISDFEAILECDGIVVKNIKGTGWGIGYE